MGGIGRSPGRPPQRRPSPEQSSTRRVEVTTLRKPAAGRARSSVAVTTFVEVPMKGHLVSSDVRRRP